MMKVCQIIMLYILNVYNTYVNYISIKLAQVFFKKDLLLIYIPGTYNWKQTFLVLMKSQIVFKNVLTCAFGFIVKNSLPNPGSQRFVPVFKNFSSYF